MVLLRHRYGSHHGFPLSALNELTDWRASTSLDKMSMWDGTFSRTTYFRKSELTSLIRKDQLLMHLYQRVWFPPD